MKRGTHRQETEKTLSQLVGQNKTVFQGLAMMFGQHRYTRWAVYALVGERVADWGYAVGRMMGWW